VTRRGTDGGDDPASFDEAKGRRRPLGTGGASAVFVHAWWRSSSTYVWSKLRQDPTLRCYYEPLHEQLATLDRAAIESNTEAALRRQLRHPIVEGSYFDEYLDLVASGRLGFSVDLAYARYLLRPGEPDEGLRAYLGGLIGAATAAGSKPVLCFCRSQMRSAWMKATFGQVHVAQLRSPLEQWASFQVNPYFIRQMLIIALRLRSRCPLAFAHIARFDQQAKALAQQKGNPGAPSGVLTIHPRDALSVFLVLWIASALQVLGCCDRVLDVDRLSSDAAYRQESARWFASHGCSVEFNDCTTPSAERLHSQDFEAVATQAAEAIRSNAAALVVTDVAAVAPRLASLSAPSRRLLEQALPPAHC